MYTSDGCAGKYKNLNFFMNLCLHEEGFDIPAEWHFFATNHGKGSSHGIGGTIKHEATKASLQQPYKDQILTALDLFNLVESSLNGISAEFLTCADWQTEEDLLPDPYIKSPINKAAATVCQFLPTAISGSRLCAVFCQWHKYSGKLGQKAAQN